MRTLILFFCLFVSSPALAGPATMAAISGGTIGATGAIANRRPVNFTPIVEQSVGRWTFLVLRGALPFLPEKERERYALILALMEENPLTWMDEAELPPVENGDKIILAFSRVLSLDRELAEGSFPPSFGPNNLDLSLARKAKRLFDACKELAALTGFTMPEFEDFLEAKSDYILQRGRRIEAMENRLGFLAFLLFGIALLPLSSCLKKKCTF